MMISVHTLSCKAHTRSKISSSNHQPKINCLKHRDVWEMNHRLVHLKNTPQNGSVEKHRPKPNQTKPSIFLGVTNVSFDFGWSFGISCPKLRKGKLMAWIVYWKQAVFLALQTTNSTVKLGISCYYNMNRVGLVLYYKKNTSIIM